MRTLFSERFAKALVCVLDKATWREELHPRDDDGKWVAVPGLGTPKGPVEIFDENELKETLPKTEKGTQYFENVNVDLIKFAFKYNEALGGIKALVIKKDGLRAYKYTDEHNQKKTEKKIQKNARLGDKIGEIEKQVKKDMESRDDNIRATATIVDIINTTMMRIGGGRTEEDTGSSGASTLKPEHFTKNRDGSLRVQFLGKSGVDWDVTISDPALVRNINDFMSGKKKDENIFPVSPREVNEYLKPWKVTAKDFRTFHASSMAMQNLAELPDPATLKEAKKNIKDAVEKTAKVMGHTPAVCKSAYIAPFILQNYLAKVAEKKVEGKEKKKKKGGKE